MKKKRKRHKRRKKDLKLERQHYYFIYIVGFFLFSLAVFVCVKNVVSTISPNHSQAAMVREVKMDKLSLASTKGIKGNGEEAEITADQLEGILKAAGKTERLPPDHKIQIYFYDSEGSPRSDLFFIFENGEVRQEKTEDYEISIATSVNNIPELKKSTSFCLVMETLWVRDQDVKIEYGMSRLMALTKYGSFAKSCVPSAMGSVTGFSIAEAEPSRADMFYWYAVMIIALIMGLRFYLDMIEKGY